MERVVEDRCAGRRADRVVACKGGEDGQTQAGCRQDEVRGGTGLHEESGGVPHRVVRVLRHPVRLLGSRSNGHAQAVGLEGERACEKG